MRRKCRPLLNFNSICGKVSWVAVFILIFNCLKYLSLKRLHSCDFFENSLTLKQVKKAETVSLRHT